MEFIIKLLNELNKGVNILDVCRSIHSQGKYTGEKSPLFLLDLIKEPVISIERINDCAKKVTTTGVYIIKRDEQYKANELSFVTNCLAHYFGINMPLVVLSCDNHEPTQIIEYIDDWTDLRIRSLDKVKYLGSDLGKLLAFALCTGSTDNFLYLSRLIDNIIFKNDPEYVQMDEWEASMVNNGNIGIVDGNLWLIDARPGYEKYQLQTITALGTDSRFRKKLFYITRVYFELDKEEAEPLITSFDEMYTKLMANQQLIATLIEWAGGTRVYKCL